MVFTHAELNEMWKRPVERQYAVAISKILEAINATKGDITIAFSGGKDSSLLLDMYCDLVRFTSYGKKTINVVFANTTNETYAMRCFVKSFIKRCEEFYGVKINFVEVKPENTVWAKFVLEHGIPLISKMQARYIRTVKSDMTALNCDFDTVSKLYRGDEKAVKELKDIGFSDSSVLYLTGWVTSRDEFGKKFLISKKWFPMINCEIDLTEQCCIQIKERPMEKIASKNYMTGEQAAESANREANYLRTGCNIRLPNGDYKSKPFGAMTKDGILYSLQFRSVPICSDYGEIVKDDDGHYRCTKAQRTGCALCGFGCQYDVDRFVRLQETEPQKVRFAFKPKSEGGAGYKEAIEYMNEHCGTKVKIPEV